MTVRLSALRTRPTLLPRIIIVLMFLVLISVRVYHHKFLKLTFSTYVTDLQLVEVHFTVEVRALPQMIAYEVEHVELWYIY
jgi:hypothetical protein